MELVWFISLLFTKSEQPVHNLLMNLGYIFLQYFVDNFS